MVFVVFVLSLVDGCAAIMRASAPLVLIALRQKCGIIALINFLFMLCVGCLCVSRVLLRNRGIRNLGRWNIKWNYSESRGPSLSNQTARF